MSKNQLEELKARIAEHTKKHPQVISHKDLQSASMSPPKAKVVPKAPSPIEAAMDALEDSVENLLGEQEDT